MLLNRTKPCEKEQKDDGAEVEEAAGGMTRESPLVPLTDESAMGLYMIDGWTKELGDIQIRELLISLIASTAGDMNELRDRLSRAVRRLENSKTPWSAKDDGQYEFLSSTRDECTQLSQTLPSTSNLNARGLPGWSTVGRDRRAGGEQINFPGIPPPIGQCNVPPPDIPLNVPPRSEELNIRQPATRFQPGIVERIKAWGIEFGGTERENVETFLKRLTQCSMSCGFAPDELCRVLPIILKDAASTWWSVKCTQIYTYDAFAAAIKRRFSMSAMDSRLFTEIIMRTQGKLESGADYLDSVQSMWLMVHSQIPLRDRLNITFNNLRVEYHQVIMRADFNTFEELEELVYQYDLCCRRPVNKSTPVPRECVLPEYITPRARRAEVAAVAACDTNAVRATEKRKAETVAASNEVKRLSTPPYNDHNAEKGIRTVKCFNCGKTGHRHRKCTSPKVIFCYRCGQCDVKMPECPKCGRTRVKTEEENASAPGNE